MGIKFDKGPLAAEQSNYFTKIVNVHIVYDLDAWPKNSTNNFKFKNCLFGETNIVKNSDKEKYLYKTYGIIFDSAGSWSFDSDTVKNVVSFSVDNSSPSHADNRKNNLLVLGDDATFVLMEALVQQKKSLVLILVKQSKNFA